MAILTTHRRMMTIDGLSPASVMHAGLLGAAYRDKVLGYGPIAYWMLAEAAGVTAIDQVNSPAQDGTHVGVTLGQAGIGDGETCPLYDGANDYTRIHTAAFAGAFDGAEGTVLIWAKVSGAGIWTDATRHCIVSIAVDSNTNQLRIFKDLNNNRLTCFYEAGNVLEELIINGVSDVDWMPLALTWSAIADEAKIYKDGILARTAITLGVWAGALDWRRTLIGARYTDPIDPWDGWLAHCAVWDAPLSGPDILDLSTV